MDFEEAKSIIIYESTEGVAYTSRHGAYPDRERVDQIIEALKTINEKITGDDAMDRKLAAALFVINDQYQGNMSGASSKGVELEEDVFDNFIEINEMLYCIFEDWDNEA